MIIILIVLSIVLISIVVIVLWYQKQKKYDRFILQNSLCLKELNEINEHYQFFPNISFDQQHTYDNANFFDCISCEDYLIYQLQFIKKDVFSQIKKVKANRQLYSNYIEETTSITQFGQFQASTAKLNHKMLLKREQALLKKQTLRAPVMQFELTVTLYCSKINGQIYQKKRNHFTDAEILTLISRLNKKNGYFYNDREIWNAICRVERGKVSNKMRFSIYARDDYRCRRCGASGKSVQLEIDHIIPIAKGGKSTYNNLQTLCHKCNVEKGDNYKLP